jgi:indoleamine 2,3-dioxygenase
MAPALQDSVKVPLSFLLALVALSTGLVVLHIQNNQQSITTKKKEDNEKQEKECSKCSKPPQQIVPQTPVRVQRNQSYRIEEENTKRTSSEFTRRGQLWSKHASWHLPDAPRVSNSAANFLSSGQGLEHVRAILKKFDVDPITGFLPSEDPLQRLPYARYHLWEDLGDDLPKLLGARLGQARSPLEQLPVLSTDKLVTDAELKRAHLLLCLFAHAYVWGGTTPKDTIPAGIAKPLWEVSERLGIPPVLGHPSIVLYNWRRLDVNGEICMENLSTLNNFFDGRDESWFYLITVEIEARGAAAVVPMMLTLDAIQRYDEEARVTGIKAKFWGEHQYEDSDKIGEGKKFTIKRKEDNENDDVEGDEAIYTDEALIGELSPARVNIFVTAQLEIVANAIKGTCESLGSMREGCHPFIFYHRVRPFLSGWKHNPTMPSGVVYEGVSSVPQQFYGGSAAQSSLLPFLDITLGIGHESSKSRDFLLAMRDYMLKPHREFLSYLETISCLREYVLKQIEGLDELEGDDRKKEILTGLRDAYDNCVIWLKKFREGHMSLVAEYIISQQRGKEGKKGSLENTAGGKGTGGTDLMGFLRPIRNDCAQRYVETDFYL